MQFQIAATLLAVVCVVIMFAVWFAVQVALENRRIKQSCLALQQCIGVLRRHKNANALCEMDENEKVSFYQMQQAFNKHIKPYGKYRQNLLCALNSICGTSYSLFDMHDCFENSRLNGFFKDIVDKSGYLFINIVYMSSLEEKGFYISEVDISSKL